MKVAVIGSGPGAMYTVKYFLKQVGSRPHQIDVLERLQNPFGLVRYGVAPDHPEVKEVSKEFNSLFEANRSTVHLRVNSDVCGKEEFDNLRRKYDAVLIGTGAQGATRLSLPSLPRYTMSARDFVMHYNGHPDFSSVDLPVAPRTVTVVGHGNVALDVARILSKSKKELEPLVDSGLLAPCAYEWLKARQELSGEKTVSLLGRRGYMAAAFTNKEFRELTQLESAICRVNEGELEMSLGELQTQAKGERTKFRGLSILSTCIDNFQRNTSAENVIQLRFNTAPLQYISDPVSGIEVRNSLGIVETIPCELGIESIGFKVTNEFGLPMDSVSGGVAHDGRGRVVGFPGVYVAGWAKRGPKGVIAANIPCCVETADAMAHDLIDQTG